MPPPPASTATAESVTRRAGELLALGRRLVEQIDLDRGKPVDGGLALADQASADAATLQSVNLRLLPLLQRLRQRPGGSSWWRWFTGQRLEQQVLFESLCQQIEALAELGQATELRLKQHAQALALERRRMAVELQRMATDAAALQLLLTAPYASDCHAAGLRADDLERLSRRAANLETLATATQLGRGQYKVTLTHLQAVADRFAELRTLLLPLWKQTVGFELFAQRLRPAAPHADS